MSTCMHFVTGVDFWPLSDVAFSSNLEFIRDFNRHTCWTPNASLFTIETYITVGPSTLKIDPLAVQLWMKNVRSCGEESNLPLVVSLLNSPSYKATPGGQFMTTNALSMIQCDVIETSIDGDHTVCAFNCPSKGNNIVGHAFRLASLAELNANYIFCEVEYVNATKYGFWATLLNVVESTHGVVYLNIYHESARIWSHRKDVSTTMASLDRPATKW